MTPIISLTTIPSRLPHIEPCIRSLEKQGLAVYVWIQEEVERTGNVFDGHVPDFLGKCEVEVVPERGPITKLLPALKISEVVITADDDEWYGEGWADGLLEWHERLPGMALCYRGRIFTDGQYNNTICTYDVGRPMEVDLSTGAWGVLYHRDYFSDDIFDDWRVWPMNDDLVINAHLRGRGVKRVVVPIPRGCKIGAYHDVHRINALWKENQHRNDRGLEAVGWF